MVGGDARVTHLAGAANNTTNAFDGTYTGVSINNSSKGNTLATVGASATLKCQNFDQPPTLTVTNGLAQFEALGVTFAGYVTPESHLRMHSGYGATVTGQVKPAPIDEDFDGQFDALTHVLNAQLIGACVYKASWQRTA
jgi:hypothetical protein